jgi:hypothetical protein
LKVTFTLSRISCHQSMSAGHAHPTSVSRRRIGVDAASPSHRWWALSCTSLNMLLWALAAAALIGAVVSLMRPRHGET